MTGDVGKITAVLDVDDSRYNSGMDRAEAKARELDSKFSKPFQIGVGIGTAMAGINMLINAAQRFGEAIGPSAAMSWEKGMGSVTKILDMDKHIAGTQQLTGEYKNLNNELQTLRAEMRGVNSQDIYGGASVLASRGFGKDEIVGATEAVIQAKAAFGDLGIEDTANLLGTATLAWKEQTAAVGGNAEMMKKVASAANELGKGPATESNIVRGTAAMSGYATMLGMTVQETEALVATFEAANVMGPETATAMKSAINAGLAGVHSISDPTIAKLLGLDISDKAGRMTGYQVGAKVMGLSEADYRRKLEENFGLTMVKTASAIGKTGLSETYQTGLAELIYGGEAGAQWLKLAGQEEQLTKNQAAANEGFREGTSVTEEYTNQTDNATDALGELMGSMEVGAIKAWDAALEPMQGTFDNLAQSVRSAYPAIEEFFGALWSGDILGARDVFGGIGNALTTSILEAGSNSIAALQNLSWGDVGYVAGSLIGGALSAAIGTGEWLVGAVNNAIATASSRASWENLFGKLNDFGAGFMKAIDPSLQWLAVDAYSAFITIEKAAGPTIISIQTDFQQMEYTGAQCWNTLITGAGNFASTVLTYAVGAVDSLTGALALAADTAQGLPGASQVGQAASTINTATGGQAGNAGNFLGGTGLGLLGPAGMVLSDIGSMVHLQTATNQSNLAHALRTANVLSEMYNRPYNYEAALTREIIYNPDYTAQSLPPGTPVAPEAPPGFTPPAAPATPPTFVAPSSDFGKPVTGTTSTTSQTAATRENIDTSKYHSLVTSENTDAQKSNVAATTEATAATGKWGDSIRETGSKIRQEANDLLSSIDASVENAKIKTAGGQQVTSADFDYQRAYSTNMVGENKRIAGMEAENTKNRAELEAAQAAIRSASTGLADTLGLTNLAFAVATRAVESYTEATQKQTDASQSNTEANTQATVQAWDLIRTVAETIPEVDSYINGMVVSRWGAAQELLWNEVPLGASTYTGHIGPEYEVFREEEAKAGMFFPPTIRTGYDYGRMYQNYNQDLLNKYGGAYGYQDVMTVPVNADTQKAETDIKDLKSTAETGSQMPVNLVGADNAATIIDDLAQPRATTLTIMVRTVSVGGGGGGGGYGVSGAITDAYGQLQNWAVASPVGDITSSMGDITGTLADIPWLAGGGYVPEPTLAVIGDAPGGEWVMNQSQIGAMGRNGNISIDARFINNAPIYGVSDLEARLAKHADEIQQIINNTQWR